VTASRVDRVTLAWLLIGRADVRPTVVADAYGRFNQRGEGAQLDSAALCPNSVASDGPPEDECDPGHAPFRAWEVSGAATV
jgi:hypothetical protein